MTHSLFLFVVSLGSLLFAHLAAIATKVLQDAQWHELEVYSKKRDKKRFDVIFDNSEEVETGTETSLYLALAVHVFTGLAWVVTTDLIGFTDWFDLVIGVSVGTAVLLSMLVWLPKAVAEYAGTWFLFHTWGFWSGVSLLLRPLSVGSRLCSEIVRRLFNVTVEESEEEALEEEIRTIVAEGEHDGLLDADTRDMIEGVIELDDLNVADIMTSRDKMDVMSAELGWDDVLKFVTDVGRTRIPVYNGSRNDFLGVLYVKDLFAEFGKERESRRTVRELLRQSWSVPMTMHLDELLQQFRQTRNHLALVVDEYNAVAGLVTIEDVLEEIVGEIVDESDKEDLGDVRVISDTEAEVLGRAHLEDVNEQLGYDLPEDDEFDTVSGFLMHQLGHVPRQGESVYWNDLKLSVVEASRRRAELVSIRVKTELPSDAITGRN